MKLEDGKRQLLCMCLVQSPQCTDILIAKRCRLAYAHVCVEIDIGTELPEVVHTREPNGAMFEQVVEYEWVPTQCRKCNKFRHLEVKCMKKSVGRPSMATEA